MGRREQEPPFTIQVELSEGCNLYCDFCGLQGIRTPKIKNFKFLTLRNARIIAQQIHTLGWNSRIEFAMHGEPTMHPKFIEVVRTFRQECKNQLMMTSNGGGIVRDPVGILTELFDAGLNIFAYDAYEYTKLPQKIMGKIEAEDEVPFNMHYYPEENVSPHSRYGKGARKFIRVQDISVADKGTHATLNNHAGSGSPVNKNAWGKRCAKVFREISIRWNGNVAICCNDWRGEYKCGNVIRDGLGAVWQSDEMDAARKFLVRGQREHIPVCAGCDALSYRVGLLPDKKGKEKLPDPKLADHKIVARASSGKTYAPIVFRPYEKGKANANHPLKKRK